MPLQAVCGWPAPNHTLASIQPSHDRTMGTGTYHVFSNLWGLGWSLSCPQVEDQSDGITKPINNKKIGLYIITPKKP